MATQLGVLNVMLSGGIANRNGLHLDRCRLRIEEIIKNDPVEKVRLEAAHQRLALGQDDAPQNKKPKVTGGGECRSGDARVHGPTV